MYKTFLEIINSFGLWYIKCERIGNCVIIIDKELNFYFLKTMDR